jgi:hypothetical protein
MLSWIAGSRVDHPMADPKKAREIIAGFPAGDAAKALDEATYWLDSLNHTGGYKVDRRFENIDLVDGAAKSHQRKLSLDYLAMERQQKFRENKLWTGVFGFWKELGDAYLLCVGQSESGTTSAIRKSMPVIVGRALRALTLQVKWILLRYGTVEPRLWSEISRLYQTAEAGGYADHSVAIYPGSHGMGSVSQEFLKAVMLSASSTDGLTPLKQEIAERTVAHFSGAFVLGPAPSPACPYAFDLAQSRPPFRVIKGTPAAPTLRFFGAGEGLAQLKRLRATLRENGALPKDVNLGGTYTPEMIVSVFDHLAQYWSDQPPARNSERRKTATRITVVPGLTETLDTLDPANNDALDFSATESAESWIVENVSDGGYGAIIPAARSDWIKIGGLIGVQGETSTLWGIGVIRRVGRDEHQQRRVGIQLLTQTAIPVKLARGASDPMEAAILLSTSPDKNGEVGIVMREGVFNSRDSLEMTVNNKSYLLMPAKMVEGGEDYDWARFKVMQRST